MEVKREEGDWWRVHQHSHSTTHQELTLGWLDWTGFRRANPWNTRWENEVRRLKWKTSSSWFFIIQRNKRDAEEDEETSHAELSGGWKRRSKGVLMKPSRDLWKEHLLFSSYESWDSMRRRWCRSEREEEEEDMLHSFLWEIQSERFGG